jgi:hypothetical protein
MSLRDRRHASYVPVLSILTALTIALSLGVPVGFAASQLVTRQSACTLRVPSGSTVNPSTGSFLLPNGSIMISSNSPCSPSIPYSITGNAAYGVMTLSGSYYYTNYQDWWQVPPAPSNGAFTSPQGLAFWDGLQGGYDLVQPLLVYGCIISSDCANAWRITGYALCCGLFGTAYYSTPFNANKGDNIVGTLILNPHVSFCPSDGPAYTVAAGDSTTGQTTNLIICITDHYQTAVTGSLEVHQLSTCNQMPGSGTDYFEQITYTTSPSGGSASQSHGSDVSFCNAYAQWYNSQYGTFLTLSWSFS